MFKNGKNLVSISSLGSKKQLRERENIQNNREKGFLKIS